MPSSKGTSWTHSGRRVVIMRAKAERLPSGAMTASSIPGTCSSARRMACRPSASMPSSLVSRTCIQVILSCQGRLTPRGALCKACLTVRNDVRLLRTARDLSQGALADALGVSRQTINAIETGRYLPSLPLAFGLARFFETTVEQIFHPDSEEIPT